MESMNRAGKRVLPQQGKIREFHDRKYKVFLRMYEDQLAYRELMGR